MAAAQAQSTPQAWCMMPHLCLQVPVVLELGGKDAIVVCDDADYNQAFNHGMRGGFQSNGQNCAGAERYFVHASLYEVSA